MIWKTYFSDKKWKSPNFQRWQGSVSATEKRTKCFDSLMGMKGAQKRTIDNIFASFYHCLQDKLSIIIKLQVIEAHNCLFWREDMSKAANKPSIDKPLQYLLSKKIWFRCLRETAQITTKLSWQNKLRRNSTDWLVFRQNFTMLCLVMNILMNAAKPCSLDCKKESGWLGRFFLWRPSHK